VADPYWRLLVLSPVDTESFLGTNPLNANPVTQPTFVPFVGRLPAECPRSPQPLADGSGLNRIGPTCHAFAWVYRVPLVRALLSAWEDGPPLSPVDIWVWEVMDAQGMLGHALAPEKVHVLSRHGNTNSVKAAQ
jgi:hypothetical protein